MEFLIGLVVGAVAGGAVVFIYKKKIEKKYLEVKAKLEDEVAELREKIDKD
jgi:hypothetical protein